MKLIKYMHFCNNLLTFPWFLKKEYENNIQIAIQSISRSSRFIHERSKESGSEWKQKEMSNIQQQELAQRTKNEAAIKKTHKI